MSENENEKESENESGNENESKNESENESENEKKLFKIVGICWNFENRNRVLLCPIKKS